MPNNGHYPHNLAYLVEGIIPVTQINLLCGPSGAGKTRWLLETMLEWSLGLPVLSRTSYPVPWLYINNDRNQADLNEILDDLGISPQDIPTLPAWDLELGYNGIMDAAEKMDAKFLVWEGFGREVGDKATGFTVTSVLRRVTKDITKNGMTILGTVEQPKMKPGQKYGNPRQRVSGAAAWAHHVSTIFLLEYANEKQPDKPERKFYVCPRNDRNCIYSAVMTSQGRIEVMSKPQKVLLVGA